MELVKEGRLCARVWKCVTCEFQVCAGVSSNVECLGVWSFCGSSRNGSIVVISRCPVLEPKKQLLMHCSTNPVDQVVSLFKCIG